MSYDELVDKLIAEVRAALADAPTDEHGDSSVVVSCVKDALAAFDAGVQATRHEDA